MFVMWKGVIAVASFLVGIALANPTDPQSLLATNGVCYNTLESICTGHTNKAESDVKSDCSVKWGSFDSHTEMIKATNDLIVEQFKSSLQYMLIGSHFSGWQLNRPGFVKYFNKLSDDNWDEALKIMTHMIERGGALRTPLKLDVKVPGEKLQIYECHALSKALDTEKKIADQMLNVAHLAKQGIKNEPTKGHDSEFAHFITDLLSDNHVLRIKHLGNYVKLIFDITRDETLKPMALFKFDSEYLK